MNSTMKWLSALFLVIVLSACAAPGPRVMPTATQRAAVFPPTWTLTPGKPVTPTPSLTPRPTRTIGPAATPSASTIFTATDGIFTLKIPGNFTTQTGQRQVIGVTTEQQMNYAALSAPGTAPQPAILVFYKWPNGGPISNENAWEQAYAVASLAVKVCPMTLTTGGPIELGGETAKYIGYEDGCGVQGELIGFVHNGVNFGILIEAPKPLWEEWRPILRDVIGSLKFK
jgi:predicted small lipoprotein YifL